MSYAIPAYHDFRGSGRCLSVGKWGFNVFVLISYQSRRTGLGDSFHCLSNIVCVCPFCEQDQQEGISEGHGTKEERQLLLL
jgi:hypothetical protein